MQTHAPQQADPLFDHLVGAGEQRLWHCKSDFFRSFEIENKLKLNWLKEGNIAGNYDGYSIISSASC
jgi:hypothetical protein